MFVEILDGANWSSCVEVGLGHAGIRKLNRVFVLPLVPILKLTTPRFKINNKQNCEKA
jgi:hypothetical protein